MRTLGFGTHSPNPSAAQPDTKFPLFSHLPKRFDIKERQISSTSSDQDRLINRNCTPVAGKCGQGVYPLSLHFKQIKRKRIALPYQYGFGHIENLHPTVGFSPQRPTVGMAVKSRQNLPSIQWLYQM